MIMRQQLNFAALELKQILIEVMIMMYCRYPGCFDSAPNGWVKKGGCPSLCKVAHGYARSSCPSYEASLRCCARCTLSARCLNWCPRTAISFKGHQYFCFFSVLLHSLHLNSSSPLPRKRSWKFQFRLSIGHTTANTKCTILIFGTSIEIMSWL